MKKRIGILCLISLLGLVGCGGGGGSDQSARITIEGQAVLGPLSGATINIAGLDGTLLATGTASQSADLESAGSFSFLVSDADLPDVVVVSAHGGTDIDPEDDGVAGTEILSKGAVHAYVTKAQLKAGHVKVNPLTELIFQDLALQYPFGVSSLTSDELLALLDARAIKYLNSAVDYNDILRFLPSRDKGNSTIAWDTILSKFVQGIHEGEAGSSMQNRVSLLVAGMQSTGVTTELGGSSIRRLEDTDGDRVRTEISPSADNSVGVLEQSYIDDSGAFVSVRVEKMNSTQSYLKASISKAGHTLTFEGVTTLLQGMVFSEVEISSFVSRLISIDAVADGSLDITIDKLLATRISDNEIKFTIDGREPSTEELSVILDDPEINWKWAFTDQFSPQVAASGYTLDTYTDSELKVLTDGTVIIELSLVDYDYKSGLQGDGLDVVREGFKHIASMAAGEITKSDVLSTVAEGGVATLTNEGHGALQVLYDTFLSVPQAYYWLFTAGLPTAAERFGTSTRIGLIGKFSGANNDKIIAGEKYTPVLFVRNDHEDGTEMDLSVSMSYLTQGGEDYIHNAYIDDSYIDNQYIDFAGLPYRTTENVNMASLTVKKNKGYVVIPARKVSFFVSPDGNEHFISGTPSVQVSTQIDKLAVTRHVDFDIDTTQQYLYTDFNHVVTGGLLYLDASPSVSSNSSISTYTWKRLGTTLASGVSPQAVINVTDIDSGNGFEEIRLEVETLAGDTGSVSKTVIIEGQTWQAPTAWYADSDGDNYGNPNDQIIDFVQPVDYVSDSTDCDDNVNSINPGGVDIPGDGIDQDCIGGDAFLASLTLTDTGQTSCYDTDGTVINCAGTGQDGEFTINPPSYTDNGNETVTDNVTGLIWQQSDDDIIRTEVEATSYCSSLSLGGSSAWRKPNIRELMSIVDYGVCSPAIDVGTFPGTDLDVYSADTMYSAPAGSAWSLNFSVGDASSYTIFDGYTRCVR